MLNILAHERLKLKRNKLFLVCTLFALALPAFMIIIDLMDKSSITAIMTGDAWLVRLVIPMQVILYPVLSGFVLTFLIQKEYAEKTMINTLTATTSRVRILFGKYIIWVSWVVFITLLFSCLISGVGFSGLYWPEIIRNLIPWSAVTSITILKAQTILPYNSIFIGHLMGLFLSIYSFKNQDL